MSGLLTIPLVVQTDLEVMYPFEIPYDSRFHLGWCHRIAEHAVAHPGLRRSPVRPLVTSQAHKQRARGHLERIDDTLRRLEVHIRHPQRKNVILIFAPLHARCSPGVVFTTSISPPQVLEALWNATVTFVQEDHRREALLRDHPSGYCWRSPGPALDAPLLLYAPTREGPTAMPPPTRDRCGTPHEQPPLTDHGSLRLLSLGLVHHQVSVRKGSHPAYR
jgi:hypothetical protein